MLRPQTRLNAGTGPGNRFRSNKGDNMAETQARKEWTKENTTFVGLKPNNRTDKDILEALDGNSNRPKSSG